MDVKKEKTAGKNAIYTDMALKEKIFKEIRKLLKGKTKILKIRFNDDASFDGNVEKFVKLFHEEPFKGNLQFIMSLNADLVVINEFVGKIITVDNQKFKLTKLVLDDYDIVYLGGDANLDFHFYYELG